MIKIFQLKILINIFYFKAQEYYNKNQLKIWRWFIELILLVLKVNWLELWFFQLIKKVIFIHKFLKLYLLLQFACY